MAASLRSAKVFQFRLAVATGFLCACAIFFDIAPAPAAVTAINSQGASIISGPFAYNYTVQQSNSVLVVATYRDASGGSFRNLTFDGNTASGSLIGSRTALFYYKSPAVGSIAINDTNPASNSGIYIWELAGVDLTATPVEILGTTNSFGSANPVTNNLQITTIASDSFAIDVIGWNPISISSSTTVSLVPASGSIISGTNFTYAINFSAGGVLGGGAGVAGGVAGTKGLGWGISQSAGGIGDLNEIAYAFAPRADVATQTLSAAGATIPSTATNGQTILLTVAVTPAASPASTDIAATANLTAIGGLAAQAFYDDGTHGDQVGGDNIFSFNTTVASSTSPGFKSLNVSVADAQSRNVTARIALTVLSGQYISVPFLPVSDVAAPDAFPLAADGVAAPIYYSANDATVVGIAAKALSNDVRLVTGLAPTVSSNAPATAFDAVFIGTIGESALIDGLVAAGKMDISAIQGRWEAYTTTIVTNPAMGVSRALVIAGSDRRGTAFGVFGLSEAMGVSPWYWFGDVPVTPKSAVYIGDAVYTEPSPGVKYRGIFLNDEDWGLEPWARLTYDPAGDIGPASYAKIFELLLRMHANYIWPAMHPSTRPFFTVAGNKQVADDYAIVIGTSHHEPMERNTAEYNSNVLGAYNYWTNRAVISNFWDQRVLELTNFEAVYTTGMRGLVDDGIISPAGTTVQQKADELQNVIIPDQRAMIANRLNPNPALVPQIFVPYKEALTLYQTGMQLADDITLVWPDDNFGYIRELSTAAENARSGGSGIYYHLSYWGPPGNYLWLCTTPPAVVWEEMSKAWDYNSRRLWVVNIGDLKPGEIGMDFFLRLARNPEAFRNFDQHVYLTQWAAENFGATNADAIASVLGEYYRLNFIVRPEHLNFTTSGFSLVGNGDEAQQRLNDFSALVASANSIYAQLPAARQSAFYETVLYPIRSSALMNYKVLNAERSRLWAAQGRAATAAMVAAAQAAQNGILSETAFYNQTNAGGKWNNMLTVNAGGANNVPFLMPMVGGYAPPSAAGLGVAAEGSATVLAAANPGVLPTFNAATNASHFIDIFNTGTTPMPWLAQSSAAWILLSQTSGTDDTRLWVSIDWAHAPQGNSVSGRVAIQGAGMERTVDVNVINPPSFNPAMVPPAVENNGVVNIEAENFVTNHDSAAGVGWRIIPRAAASYDGVTVFPTTAPSIATNGITSDTPSLTYQFYTFNTGPVVVQMACLPTESINTNHPGCRYAISLNDDTPKVEDIGTTAGSSEWNGNVMVNTAYGVTTHTITNAGLQTLKVWMIDPGVVLDKLVVNLQLGPLYEAELLSFTTPNSYHTFTESGASGGAALSLDASAAGQYITLPVPNVASGVFDLTVRAKTLGNRGIAQVSSGNSLAGPFINIGSPLDFYSTNATYTNLATMRITNSTAGTAYFKFTVTGRNASSTGYVIVVDSLTLMPVIAPATPSAPAAVAAKLIGGSLNLTWPGGLGWRLQMQTNLANSNWVYVSDGDLFHTNIAIDSSASARFYRLSYP